MDIYLGDTERNENLMTTRYLTGYSGTTRTLDQLRQWDQWQMLDPEYQRRALWIMDASIAAGSPVGIGGIYRSEQTQLLGAYSRHVEVPAGSAYCCTYGGKYYQKKPNVAHMVFPPWSYHMKTTPAGKVLAIDFTGNLKWLRLNAAKAGLHTFEAINNEPWHAQPIEIPNGKRQYVPAKHHPLPVWTLPGMPAVQPTVITVPTPTLAYGRLNNITEVRELQLALNFYKWRDANGNELLVDGDFGRKTESAVKAMQTALGCKPDGIYGPVTARYFQAFTDKMTALKAA